MPAGSPRKSQGTVLKRLLKLLFIMLFLVLPGIAGYLAFSAIQPKPLVAAQGSMAHSDVGRIKALLKQNDPRGLRDGETRQVQLTGRDLNLMLNSALPAPDRQGVQVVLTDSRADVYYTAVLPPNPLGAYFNLSMQVKQEGSQITPQFLRFGDARVPGWLLRPLTAAVDRYLRGELPEYRDAMAALKQLQITPDAVELVYQWHAELATRIQDRGRDLLLPVGERERIVAYYTEISRQSRTLPAAAVPLHRLLQPLFALARERSDAGNDPEAENRALLLALGAALAGGGIDTLVGKSAADDIAPLQPLRLVLRGRDDLAKHFSISAAISATAGSGLADSIGVFKEMDDSRGGSGFSFADLLADRAGVAFAELAQSERAGALQVYMSSQPVEDGYMPVFTNLPEGLMELEFKIRYRDLDSASYALVNGEIERRIGGCSIHQRGFH
jgi:uncharacterized protein YfiM (DUF2279 family)